MSFLLNDAFNELRVFENSGYFINGFYADASLLCNVIDGCHSQFFDGMNAHSVQYVVRPDRKVQSFYRCFTHIDHHILIIYWRGVTVLLIMSRFGYRKSAWNTGREPPETAGFFLPKKPMWGCLLFSGKGGTFFSRILYSR